MLIGRGTQSCVYSPPLKFKGANDDEKYNSREYVSKVSTSPEIFIKENIIKDRLEQLDIPIDQYFILPEDTKTVEFVPTISMKRECQLLKDIGYNQIYPNGGKHLRYEELFDEREAIRRLRHLIDSIIILQTVNVFHCDIKGENILMRKGILRLSDFGNAIISNQFKPEETYFGSYFPFWPFWINVVALLTDRIKESELHRLYDFWCRYHIGDKKKWQSQLMTGTDFISITIKRFQRSPDKYFEEVIIPNIGKLDVYSTIKYFEIVRDRTRGRMSRQWDLLESQVYNPDPEQQWDVTQVSEYISSTFGVESELSNIEVSV